MAPSHVCPIIDQTAFELGSNRPGSGQAGSAGAPYISTRTPAVTVWTSSKRLATSAE